VLARNRAHGPAPLSVFTLDTPDSGAGQLSMSIATGPIRIRLLTHALLFGLIRILCVGRPVWRLPGIPGL